MLRVEDIRKSYDRQPVLRGIDLEIGQGELMCLLGPSGCGKTTLLRIISGLEAPDSGDVLLDGQSIRNLPVYERGFGFMFQDFALFPHMNVEQNVAFGLRMRGDLGTDQQARVHEVLELVGLKGFERRDVTQLSGGERQRVALARSLAPRPRLLLLDEPLGSLDAALRERLVLDLRAIIKSLGLTAVYVTHDQAEAYAISDRMALMNAGLLVQVDVPEKIYARPATVFAAKFLGLNNVVPVLERGANYVDTPLGRLDTAGNGRVTYHLLVHPDGIDLDLSCDEGAIHGEVIEAVFQGNSYRVDVQHASGQVLTFRTRSREIPLRRGAQVCLQINPEQLIFLV